MADGFVLVRGGGDLGSGIAHALVRAGHRVCIVDLPRPTCLRLGVSFASAAIRPQGWMELEGVVGLHCRETADVEAAWHAGSVPVWSRAESELGLRPAALVDARMRGLRGATPPTTLEDARLVVGIGPGFEAGLNCHCLIESNRGPNLGQVITEGRAEEHTGRPGLVLGHRDERLLRAPCAGTLERVLGLGDYVEEGDVVATVGGQSVLAGLRGMIRGLKLSGTEVGAGHKVGDVDPRREPELLRRMTDKAQAVGRGVVEALERTTALWRKPCI